MKNLLILLFITIFISGCGKNENDIHNEAENEHSGEENTGVVILSKESQETINLKTEVIREEEYNGYIKIPAVIVTDQNYEAQVSPIVAGKVKRVYASVGTYVRAGQTLMSIEGLEIGVLKADFLKAKTMLDFTEQEYNRQKSLSEQNAGSQKNLISAKAEYEKALAEFNAMDKKIHSIGLKDEDIINEKGDSHTAGYLNIKSPINGTIVERNVVVGQYIEPSFIAFKIINVNFLFADGQIYESDFNKLEKNSVIEFTTPTLPDEIFPCRITYKGQLIDEKTRTIKIRAKVLSHGNKLMPQMFGDLQVPLGENAKGILVFAESIIKIENQDYIFVQKNDTTFEKRAVTLGMKQNDKVEMKQGLEVGEKYVVKGAFNLKSELMKESLEEDEH